MKALLPLLLCPALAAQGVFLSAGPGCSFQNVPLTMGSIGAPTIGTTFVVTYTGPNYSFSIGQQMAQPHLVIGFNLTQTVIPQAWPLQPLGCIGHITPDFVFQMQPDPVRLGTFQSAMAFAIPNNPALIGRMLLAQWLTVHFYCGFAGCVPDAFVVSDAKAAIIG